MAETIVEQYIVDYLWCRAFGVRRRHKVRRGCRTGQLSVFCTEIGAYRTDHALSEQDQATLTRFFLVGRFERPPRYPR